MSSGPTINEGGGMWNEPFVRTARQVVLCPGGCGFMTYESVHPHGVRMVVRDGKQVKVDCAGREVSP